jgi:hypothetical protein
MVVDLKEEDLITVPRHKKRVRFNLDEEDDGCSTSGGKAKHQGA